jgi:hypothetical protein
MNVRGISAMVLGWWVISQVLLGGALDRIGVFGGGGSNAQSSAQLKSKGLTTPHAKGLKSPPMTGRGANKPYIQASDGLWYPATSKAGQQKVLK